MLDGLDCFLLYSLINTGILIETVMVITSVVMKPGYKTMAAHV